MRNLTRREFLHQGAVTLAGTALASCAAPAGPDPTPGGLGEGRPKRVAVIGAGLSGLVAAYELSRAGHEVTVLEGQTRVGGRVLTLRRPFQDGHFAEAGAARILPGHDLTLGYARHFALELDPFYPPMGGFVNYAAGHRTVTSAEDFLSVRPSFVKIQGGTDRLAMAFSDALTTRIQLGAEVGEVEQTEGIVRVATVGGRSFVADRVLCTVPLPVVGRIHFIPQLSQEKRSASGGGFAYQSATRVVVQVGRRFWEEDGLNGWGITDWPEELWHPTWDRSGPLGLLLSYVRGERAISLANSEPDERLTRVMDHWSDVLPGLELHAQAGTSHAWTEDRWAGSAYAAPSIAQDSALGPHLAIPEGRVHFAGEHASASRGWMQGALASGLRAAAEIHRAA